MFILLKKYKYLLVTEISNILSNPRYKFIYENPPSTKFELGKPRGEG